MKQDIPELKVKGVGVAIVPTTNKAGAVEWNAYLLNMRPDALKNVLISSSGYGESEGRKLETSVLRYFFESVEPETVTKIEPLMEDVFKLTNQYWVSFSQDGQMYDKRYIFVRDSIHENNMIDLPILEQKGVLIL